MAFTNSPLVTYTRISPNRNSPRTESKITKITIHHMAGVLSVEGFGNIVANPNRRMSANYAISNDGRIGLFCEEKDRSWCSSSALNDNMSVTIEVSNSASGDASGWPISDAAYKSLIKLCVDICKRNGIKKLEFTGDKNGSLTYHYMFSPTSCLPINKTELLTPYGWVKLSDIQVGDTVATVKLDDLGIKFDEVLDVVPVKQQDTYVMRDFEATSDHRVLCYNEYNKQTVQYFKDLYETQNQYYFPNAGFIENPKGFHKLNPAEIEFLVAVQADGHYMKDGNKPYGVEFHFSKERKIKRVKEILEILGYDYKETIQSDGTTKLRIYGRDMVDTCERYLCNKCFTWEWLTMDKLQTTAFFEAILQYDGCVANNSYASSIPENIDVVQAIASLNGIGSKLTPEHDRIYFKKWRRSLGDRNKKRKPRQDVSCVTVRSGFILIRQHGRTTVTGNCPGPWIKAHTQEICDKVNAQLNAKPEPKGYTVNVKANTQILDNPNGKKVGVIDKAGVYTIIEDKKIGYITYGKLKSGAGWVVVKDETPATKPSTGFKAGDLVSIASNAVYYNGGGIPEWVKRENWYISSISGDRAVLGQNQAKNRNIQSPINTKFLTKVSDSVSNQIKVGDWVKVVNPIIYGTNKKFVVYVSKYKVLELKGDRAVISSDGKNITTAISTSNIVKI